ncbi:hypothetical protein CI109_104068 [Kwoniella shandongensis]|uniref:Uncharacterized protein n=1 Tax=Kwoniella shandongensis TaxID=1734106 RepID=A0A5M6BXB8_9TREE|nr:uncharacterized protein CI109_004046 [Kwoniella shandongensis]KAA5527508.1 hypothetical protein CI109_004046 [Kwoniella shandongensis]
MVEVTLDNRSPVYQFYSHSPSPGGWVTNHTGDDFLNQYFLSTFAATYSDGDSVSLAFNGTKIVVYGAKRANHGRYAAQMDGGDILYQDGYAATNTFKQPLYTASGLSGTAEHTVSLSNAPTTPVTGINGFTWFDIDYVAITTTTSAQAHKVTYDDTASNVQYFGTGWSTNGTQFGNYYNTTSHYTSHIGDSFQLQFNGTAVQIYGSVFTDHGNYSVSIDGGEKHIFNGSYSTLQTGTTIYLASNLKDGPHTMTVTNLGGNPTGNSLDFDFAEVYVSPASTSSTSTLPHSATGLSSSVAKKGSAIGTGAIVGIVIGCVSGLAILATLIWFCRRRLRKTDDGYLPYNGRQTGKIDLTGEEVKPYAQAAPMISTSGLEQDQLTVPFLSPHSPSPLSNTASSPQDTYVQSSYGFPSSQDAGEHSTSGTAVSSSGHSDAVLLTSRPKAPAVGTTLGINMSDLLSTTSHSNTTPTSASPPTNSKPDWLRSLYSHPLPSTEGSAAGSPSRPQGQEYLLGDITASPTSTQAIREQDAGPFIPHGQRQAEEIDVLPPDYRQATASSGGRTDSRET